MGDAKVTTTNDSPSLSIQGLSDNPFWQYSLRVYQQANCADFLLDAQNHYGFDVNVLLFIGWLAHQKKILAISPVFNQTIDDFQKQTIRPIRNIRIRAKALNNLAFYNGLKKLELTAECIEQQRLYELSSQMPISTEQLEMRINQSFEVYISQGGITEVVVQKNNWLQTLIQHLQPDIRL